MNRTHKHTMAARKGLKMAVLAAALASALPAAAELSAVTHRLNMSGKQSPNGMVLWLNSVIRPRGIPRNQAVTICVTQQVISVRIGADTELIEVPDAVITFKPWETQGHVYSGGTKWETSMPSSQVMNGATFMSGETYPLPSGLPRDLRTMTWTARFESDTPGVSVQWQWGAAAYTQFSDHYDALNVASGGRFQPDAAGTPTSFKDFAIGDINDATRFTGLRSTVTNATAEVTGRCGGVF
jgi:hypothetical protein